MKRSYECENCGKTHIGLPAITFRAPYHYHILSDKDKEEIAEINTDFCVIRYSERTDRFIRVILLQKLTDACEDLDYGVWVSLSEESFNDYLDNYDSEEHETSYFGWLCNQISPYENTLTLKTTVYTQKGNSRPIAVIHSDEDSTNKFVCDYFSGITEKEAIERTKDLL